MAEFGDPAVKALLVEVLDELSERYGGSGDDTPIGDDDFTSPNGAFFVADDGERLVGCAGWRRHGSTDAELKRMFTAKAARGRGLARRMLAAIEESAREAGCDRLILETGDKQPEAIALYESAGYARIEDFGYYKGHADVLSFAKEL
ncbi:GNAT family N-acetyltransferase [Actinoplanes sp. CA-142083]|uniref:GNAT family N-acetyltransferase n=1 Tax=Actinoplanes sp. CA-142083 TaxID=3239903 RepID=UPI003D8C86EE